MNMEMQEMFYGFAKITTIYWNKKKSKKNKNKIHQLISKNKWFKPFHLPGQNHSIPQSDSTQHTNSIQCTFE